MKLFEFEAKEILKSRGAKVPRSILVSRGDRIEDLLRGSGLEPPLVVKSQVLVAGRGKAGGVKKVGSLEEAAATVKELFEKPIKGLKPDYILVEEAVEHSQELYVSIIIDRNERKPLVLASSHGGVDIEEIARESPESIVRRHVNPWIGLRGYEARLIGKRIGLSGGALASFTSFLLTMYRVFVELDADLVESNPLAVAGDEVIPLDARIIVDDNSLYRHPDLLKRKGESSEHTPWEAKAREAGLAFVELDGDIGIIGNGAGLTMATMDLVHAFGGRPANFLDIGGGAGVDVVRRAVELLLEYPRARKIFINIFGGITRCDEVAKGIVEAIRSLGKVEKPLVIRLSGTNEEEGRRILMEAGFQAFTDPVEAVKRVVSL
ncbi:MAG: ADP-forming succinate--CoA ligase subunit beta [Desulfurococcales archaeon]|nr:ADP-forming succinate--CoA ligase subunit beta [Desulfurococcales archaeon]